MRYAILDDLTKVVLNLIRWDGVTPYTPSAGTSLLNVTDIFCDIGWIQQPDGSFAPPQI
jgi:hypothetical protein